jgi:hypothetical protein
MVEKDAVSKDFRKQVLGYGLTTAEIVYRRPDRHWLLQTYVWQDYAGAWRWRAAHGRARARKAHNPPSCRRWNCRRFSPRAQRKDKDLAGIDTIWISNLVPVCFVNEGVSRAGAFRGA